MQSKTAATRLWRHKKVFTKQPWALWRVKYGEKGPIVWEVKHAPAWIKGPDGLPMGPWQLLVCRNATDPAEVNYFASNAPPGTPTETLLLAAFSRWKVERCF